ncbi:MAG: hypothetical protein Q8P10_02105 [bacterium]|nr:hypothetical protein [bacterium]
MIGSVGKSILRTLLYSDIFDYPLKESEIRRLLITEDVKTVRLLGVRLTDELKDLSSLISQKKQFYFLRNRDQIVKKRLEREKESSEKLKIAIKVCSKLSRIPTVQLIAISGGLAMRNSDRSDDIDLFIISSNNKLWITRLLLIIFLKFIGRHRGRQDKNVKDKICLNFLIDESSLSFSKEKQDVYNAHEIVQMLSIFERNNMYNRFIEGNKWVSEYLPNTVKHRTKPNNTQNYTEFLFSVVLCPVLISSVFEQISKNIQLWYMKRYQTNEVITDHMLAFHPIDNRKRVLSLYRKKLRKYKLI